MYGVNGFIVSAIVFGKVKLVNQKVTLSPPLACRRERERERERKSMRDRERTEYGWGSARTGE